MKNTKTKLVPDMVICQAIAQKNVSGYVLDEFSNLYNSKSTKSAYFKDSVLFFGYLAKTHFDSNLNFLSSIRLAHIISYKEAMTHDGLSDSTINRRLGSLKAFMKYLFKKGLCNSFDLSSIHIPKVVSDIPNQEPLTRKEVDMILSAPDIREHKGRVYRLAMFLIFYMGLNREEVSKIKVQDYDRDCKTITTIGRGGVVKKIPLDPLVIDEISFYLSRINYKLSPGDFLLQTDFLSKNSAPMDGSTIYRAIQRYAEQARIPKKVNPRNFRLTAIKEMTSKQDTALVAATLGHTCIRSTERYTSCLS